MANRLKRVVSTVLCATVMLTMTAVPGAVFAQTDTDSSEQPETTAQTENQMTTPEHEAGEAAQETKQTPEASQETAQAPAKQQKAAAQPQASKNETKVATQAAIAPYKFDDVKVSVTPEDKRQGNTVTACKGTVELKAVLVNSTGGTYDYLWYKRGEYTNIPIVVTNHSSYTPTESGVYYATADERGDFKGPKKTKEITVNLLDHQGEAIGVKAATCTEEGHEAYWKCKNCGKMFSNASLTKEIDAPVVIPKKPHSLTIHASHLDATCTTDGHEEYWQCSTCNMRFTDQDGKNPITADQVKIPAAHNLTKTEAKAATCTKAGNNEYYTCETCGKVFTDEAGNTETTVEKQTLPATGHNMTKTDAKAATCTEDGNHKYYTCENCGKVFTDESGTTETSVAERTIPAAHDLTKTEEKAPTCTEAGNIEYWTCSRCNKIFADADGKEEFKDEDATIIPTDGHNIAGHYTPEKAPTCTEDGYEGYWTCKTCEKLFADEDCERELSEPKVIPATGHKFGEWTVKKPAGIGTEGLKERVCEKCGHVETAAIPALEANKADLNNKTELAQKTAEKKTDKSAKTGDDSSIALYALLALLAAGGACGTVYRRKING